MLGGGGSSRGSSSFNILNIDIRVRYTQFQILALLCPRVRSLELCKPSEYFFEMTNCVRIDNLE